MADPIKEETNSIVSNSILSSIMHILPTLIQKNVLTAGNRLVYALTDIPVAYLEGVSQQIRAKSSAKVTVVTKTAEAVSKHIENDEVLMGRAVNYLGGKMVKEQRNRESVVQLAIEDLKANPPKNDANSEIDSDWLDMFSKIAESKSNEDVQLFLSKILSGEIRNPGTFCPKTIQTLSILDKNTATIFQDFCNISFKSLTFKDEWSWVVCEPFGQPGNNALSPFNLSYSNLTKLQDFGLIQNDLNAWREVRIELLDFRFLIGNKKYHLQRTDQTPTGMTRWKVINFTRVGAELRDVIHVQNNQAYIIEFEKWLVEKYKLNII